MLKRVLRKLGMGAAAGAGGEEFTTARASEDGSVDSPLIRLQLVSRVFGAGKVETHALRDVSLEIERGEFVGVNGPSGCGKTTLLSILGLMDVPTSGSYTLNGVDVAKLDAATRARARNREIGFIFQSFNLLGDLSVWENVELPLTYHSMPASERRDRVAAALQKVDLIQRAKHMPSQLSGGHQQRVAVARAVVGDPHILLADEPTGNLNSEQAQAVIELLVELHKAGSTLCLVSHDPRWAGVTGRSLELFDGTIVDG